jgi:hypothetical protein
MGEMYGHQWASQQGDEPNDTWCRGLDDLSAEQFAIGLRSLLKRAEKWPPNLVEFRHLCTGYDPDAWRHRAERVAPVVAAIEDKTKKERDLEYRKSQLAKLREETGI